MQWYYLTDQDEQHPFDEAELDSLIAAGSLHAGTLVWRDGMADWEPASTHFADRLPAAAPAPAPAAAAAPARAAQPRVGRAVAAVSAPRIGLPAIGARPAMAMAGAAAASAAGRGAYGGGGGGAQTLTPEDQRAGAIAKSLCGALIPAKGWMKFVGVFFVIGGIASGIIALLALINFAINPVSAIIGALIYGGLAALAFMAGTQVFSAAGEASNAFVSGNLSLARATMQRVGKHFTFVGIGAIIYLIGTIVTMIAIGFILVVVVRAVGERAEMNAEIERQNAEARANPNIIRQDPVNPASAGDPSEAGTAASEDAAETAGGAPPPPMETDDGLGDLTKGFEEVDGGSEEMEEPE
ncbi:MAG: GYF domain-containing protein [Verrucomicrobiales bacterium]